MRTPATGFEDLVVLKLMAYRLNFGALPFPFRVEPLIEEVGKLLQAYSQAILNSDY